MYFELSWLYYQCCLFVKQVSAFIILIFDVFGRVLGLNHNVDSSFFLFDLGMGKGSAL